MNIFGVGIPEILVVLLLAAVIFGPGKLPEIAGQFGRAIRELREYARDFRDEYLTDFEEVREEFIEQRFELEQTGADLRADLAAAEEDVRLAVRDAETMTEEAIEAAKDELPPGNAGETASSSNSASQDGTADATSEANAETESRRVRRTRRRPVVRPRRAAAVGGAQGERAVAEEAAPARPSNVISLNRRRRAE